MAAILLDLSRHRLKLLAGPGDQRHAHAPPGEGEGDAAADAAAGPGDDGNTIGQFHSMHSFIMGIRIISGIIHGTRRSHRI